MPPQGVHEGGHVQLLSSFGEDWIRLKGIRQVMRRKGGKRRALFCPQCGSADLYYEAALITGYKYHCKKCSYIGAFVIEKELEEEEEES